MMGQGRQRGTTMKKSTKILLAVVLTVVGVPTLLVALLAGAVWWTMGREVGILDEPSHFLERRAALRSESRQQRPASGPEAIDVDPFEAVLYPSEGRQLLAHLAVSPQPMAPALLYLHGGTSLGNGDLHDVMPFVDAGWTVLAPTYRGENGNPGAIELWLGEVQDAANAARWLAAQPGVDPTRIYVIGHSMGGGVAAMLSLEPEVPIALTASSGGLYPEQVSIGWGFTPFNVFSRESRRLRVLHPHIMEMQREHIAYVGTDLVDFGREVAAAIAGRSTRLQIMEMQGDHFSSLPPALQAFLVEVQTREQARGLVPPAPRVHADDQPAPEQP